MPLNTILIFIAWLFIGLMVIQGFYFATRNGEIGGRWERFFDQETSTKYNQITNRALLDKFITLGAMDEEIAGKLLYDNLKHSLQVFGPLSVIEERKIELLLNVATSRNSISTHNEFLFLYEEVPVYRFPWKVRKMANCPICMSGWLGTLIYSVGLWATGLGQHGLNHGFGVAFLGWFAYCASLVFLNKLFVSVFSKLETN